MDNEFVVAVAVQAFQSGAIAADTVHARRGIARKLDPVAIERMKLGMDDGAGKRNFVPASAIEAAHRQAARGAALVGRGEPLAAAADGAFAQLRARPFADEAFRKRAPVGGPQPAAARDHQRLPIGVQRGAERVDGRGGSKLARFPPASEISNNCGAPVR